MNTPNRMNLTRRALAVFSVTGAAALMALPAVAQVNTADSTQTNVVQNVIDNGMNRDAGMMSAQVPTANACNYVNGGIGGPIDAPVGNNTDNLNSSYAAARIGIPNTGGSNISYNNSNNNLSNNSTTYSVNSGLVSPSPYGQFDARNRSAVVPYRANGPAGTSGHEIKMNLDALQARQNDASYPSAYNFGTSQASAPLPVACAPR